LLRSNGFFTPGNFLQECPLPFHGDEKERKRKDGGYQQREKPFCCKTYKRSGSSDPSKQAEITNWARDYWEAIHPHSAGGSYQNFMMEEGPERVRATYGENFERLKRIKAKYDPDNFFRVNQNIKPNKR
jgi:hypothetical protein